MQGTAMMVLKDWVEIASLIIVVFGILYRVGRMTERFETIGKQQSTEIVSLNNGLTNFRNDMHSELKKIGEILIDLAEFKGQMGRVEDRVSAQGKRLDENERRVNRMLENNRFAGGNK